MWDLRQTLSLSRPIYIKVNDSLYFWTQLILVPNLKHFFWPLGLLSGLMTSSLYPWTWCLTMPCGEGCELLNSTNPASSGLLGLRLLNLPQDLNYEMWCIISGLFSLISLVFGKGICVWAGIYLRLRSSLKNGWDYSASKKGRVKVMLTTLRVRGWGIPFPHLLLAIICYAWVPMRHYAHVLQMSPEAQSSSLASLWTRTWQRDVQGLGQSLVQLEPESHIWSSHIHHKRRCWKGSWCHFTHSSFQTPLSPLFLFKKCLLSLTQSDLMDADRFMENWGWCQTSSTSNDYLQ